MSAEQLGQGNRSIFFSCGCGLSGVVAMFGNLLNDFRNRGKRLWMKRYRYNSFNFHWFTANLGWFVYPRLLCNARPWDYLKTLTCRSTGFKFNFREPREGHGRKAYNTFW